MIKISCIIIISFFIFSFNKSFGQPGVWQTVQANPSVTLQDICFFQDGLNGWSVGSTSAQSNYLNGIYRTTNGGTNWGIIDFTSYTLLQGVFFIDVNTGWIVGSGGSVYKSTNGGLNWATQSSGTGRILYRVQFINPNTGWIAGGRQDGSDYLVLKTTNGGSVWQNLSFGSGAYSLEGLYFLNDMTGWVSGNDNTINGAIYKTTNGGLNWVRQTIPAATTTVTRISFANAAKGWAASSSIYNSGPIYYTSDGGDNWTVQTNTSQHYHYLDVKDDQNVAVVGYKVLGSTGTHVFVTSNGGVNWTDNATPISNYTSGISYTGNSIWIAADYSQILRSTNNGSNWAFQFRSARLRSISWISNSTGWITGNTTSGSTGYSLKTTNSGLSWFEDQNSPGGAQIYFAAQDAGWVLWEGNSGSVWRTINGGVNWSQYFVPSGGAWTGGMFFTNISTGWAFGSNGNLKFTSDGGVTWNSQNPASSNYIQSVFFVNNNEGWLCGGYAGGNGFISHTTNAGQTWVPQTPASGTHLLDLFFIDNNYGWATTLGGGTQKTINGGQSWTSGGSVAKDYAERILMINQNTGWLVAYNLATGSGDGLGYIYKTTDGGNGWLQEFVTSWPRSDLTDIALKNNVLWVTGNHNTVLKYEIPVGIVKTSAEIPKEYSLYQNYPNPFNPSTIIRFDIPGNTLVFLTLRIFNSSGQEVSTLVNEALKPGSYEIEWNGTNYPSGAYFYKLYAGDFTETKKMILIK